MDIKMIEPITPNEILDNMDKLLPQFVIEAVNNMLKKYYRGGTCTIKQKLIEEEMLRLKTGLTSKEIFDEKYLNFEKAFENVGWKILYDKPGFNESGEPYFEFSIKPTKGGMTT